MSNNSNNIQGKDKNLTLVLCILGGLIGAHQFYVGNIILGILYLCTGGLFTIGWLVDIVRILSNKFTDSKGLPLVERPFKIKLNIEKKTKKVKKKITEENLPIKLKGINGRLTVYKDRLIISRDTFYGMLYFGDNSERTFYYSDLQCVQHSSFGITVIPLGVHVQNYWIWSLRELQLVWRDPYCVILPFWKNKKGKELYKLINERIEKIRFKVKNINNLSNADEIKKYKELLEEGIITQEEFEKKKKELLND